MKHGDYITIMRDYAKDWETGKEGIVYWVIEGGWRHNDKAKSTSFKTPREAWRHLTSKLFPGKSNPLREKK